MIGNVMFAWGAQVDGDFCGYTSPQPGTLESRTNSRIGSNNDFDAISFKTILDCLPVVGLPLSDIFVWRWGPGDHPSVKILNSNES